MHYFFVVLLLGPPLKPVLTHSHCLKLTRTAGLWVSSPQHSITHIHQSLTQLTYHLSLYKLLHWLKEPSSHSIKHTFTPLPRCVGETFRLPVNTVCMSWLALPVSECLSPQHSITHIHQSLTQLTHNLSHTVCDTNCRRQWPLVRYAGSNRQSIQHKRKQTHIIYLQSTNLIIFASISFCKYCTVVCITLL